MKRRRILVALAAAAALVALLAVHLSRQYGLRPRPASPEASTPAGRLFADQRYALAAWIPYPHQNLGLVRREVFGDSEAAITALLRLAGGGEPRLPPFGPFLVPPSRELAIAWNGPADYAVVAEVYPSLALFARFAGRLADNPWLRGGDLDDGERRIRVTWEGSRWNVRAGEAAPSPAVGLELPPALVAVAVRGDGGPLPRGVYRLEQSEGAWRVRSQEPLPVDRRLDSLALAGSRVVALHALREAAPTSPDSPDSPDLGVDAEVDNVNVMVLFRGQMRFQPALPRAAVLHRIGAARWQLPGERLLEVLSRKPRHGREGEWSVYAHDRQGLGWGLALVPRLAPLLDGPSPLAQAEWVDLPIAEAMVSRLAAALREVPLVRRETVTRWSDFAALLEPLAARFATLSLAVTADPPALELDLMPGTGVAPPPPDEEPGEEDVDDERVESDDEGAEGN